MIKVGLIGENIEGGLLRDFPIELEKVAVIDGEGRIDQLMEAKGIAAYLEANAKAPEYGISMVTASLSVVLQGLRAYEEVVFSIALVPVYPPAESMKALTRALQWMYDEVNPDFLQILFSSPNGEYQLEQNGWIGQLNEKRCEVIAPVGAPPAFPSSLPGVVAVSDPGFLLAGFDSVKIDKVIEEKAVIVYHHANWHIEGLSTELACAIELRNRIADRLSSIPAPESAPVLLPDFYSMFTNPNEGEADIKDETPDQKPLKPGLMARVKSYLKSVLSRAIAPGSRVPDFIKEIRQVSCNGDAEQIAPCPFREESVKQPGSYVCGACGCGDREAVLVAGNVPKFGKLDYPFVSCPASMPGFSNYVPNSHEARANERKAVIEAKYDKATLNKATEKQAALSARLEKRTGWLDKL